MAAVCRSYLEKEEVVNRGIMAVDNIDCEDTSNGYFKATEGYLQKRVYRMIRRQEAFLKEKRQVYGESKELFNVLLKTANSFMGAHFFLEAIQIYTKIEKYFFKSNIFWLRYNSLNYKPKEDEMAEVYYNRGAAYLMLEKFSRAIKDLCASFELFADYQTLTMRGIALTHMEDGIFFFRGKFLSATEDFKASLELNPDQPFIYRYFQ